MERQNSLQSKNLQFHFSFFRNTWSKESTIVTLHNLYLQTISSLWKAQTECYRKLQDRPDRSNEAKMVKDAMPVVIIEGICRPHCSHAAANLEKMSGLAMYDLDHLNERTSAVKALFRALPYVPYTQTSISGRGLKVIVFLDARTPEEYPLAYAICRQTLEQIAGHPCYGQCARITQPCSCVCGIPTLTTTLPPNPTHGVKNLPPILRWPICSKLKTITAAATMATTRIITTEKPLLSLLLPKPADTSKLSSATSPNTIPGKKAIATNPCWQWEEAHDVRDFRKRKLKN